MVSDGAEDGSTAELLERRATPRRSPRVSFVVVLPENHVVSPDRLAEGLCALPLAEKNLLSAQGDPEFDVVIAFAGEPANREAIQGSVGDAQLIFAPAGTTAEDLRELAMRQAPGDIVTLLCGDPVSESCADTGSS